jgi:hypothetical protein
MVGNASTNLLVNKILPSNFCLSEEVYDLGIVCFFKYHDMRNFSLKKGQISEGIRRKKWLGATNCDYSEMNFSSRANPCSQLSSQFFSKI